MVCRIKLYNEEEENGQETAGGRHTISLMQLFDLETPPSIVDNGVIRLIPTSGSGEFWAGYVGNGRVPKAMNDEGNAIDRYTKEQTQKNHHAHVRDEANPKGDHSRNVKFPELGQQQMAGYDPRGGKSHLD